MNNNPMTAKKFADALAIAIIVLILFALFGFTGLFSSIELGMSETVNQNSDFPEESISEIKIDIATADLTILKGDKLSVESSKNCFRVKNVNGRITIEEKNSLFSRKESRYLKIYIPEDFTFNKVEIDTGAADIAAELLKAESLELDIGAGDVEFDSLEVTKNAEIDCGAGEFTVKNGALVNLDFSLGVGSADITALIDSKADIESGVGELNLNLLGGKDAYSIEIEKGLGIFTVDSKRTTETLIGNGEREIHIEGGVGPINVKFSA